MSTGGHVYGAKAKQSVRRGFWAAVFAVFELGILGRHRASQSQRLPGCCGESQLPSPEGSECMDGAGRNIELLFRRCWLAAPFAKDMLNALF